MTALATLDQLSGAAHHLRDNWGDYDYRLGYVGSDEFQVRSSDGSEFTFYVDFYGNVLFDDLYLNEAMAVFERIPVSELNNPVSLERMIDLYTHFQVDSSIINRYRQRMSNIKR
ncbi:MAG: hypothetical protein IIB55_08945, partial [Planctomycetes bacterium]|nr:hypothetical protein [Planctomycetota bacterium]